MSPSALFHGLLLLAAVSASFPALPRADVRQWFASPTAATPTKALGSVGDRNAATEAEVQKSVRADAGASVALPLDLAGTGLFLAGSATQVDPRNLPYAPQYPLWSDGALKRRWIYLPAGSWIDASNPDAWVFPRGTKFWKEFRFGRRVETRYIERRADGSFLYATYVWNAAETRATLAPEGGVRRAAAIGPGVEHDIPGQSDCRACHEGRKSPVLGFGALQLSPDRDPNALHREVRPAAAVDLKVLLEMGLVRNLPITLSSPWPRIAAPSPTARAALGYLFGNCAACHNAEGPLAGLGLDFDQRFGSDGGADRVAQSTIGRFSHFQLPGETESQRIAAGDPARSTVFFRMASRKPNEQMPPLGTHQVDRDGLTLIKRWILDNTLVVEQQAKCERSK